MDETVSILMTGDAFILGSYADGTAFKFPVAVLYENDVWFVHRKLIWKYVEYATRLPAFHKSHCHVSHRPTGYSFGCFTSLKRARGMVDWMALNCPGYTADKYQSLAPELLKDWRGVMRSFKGWR